MNRLLLYLLIGALLALLGWMLLVWQPSTERAPTHHQLPLAEPPRGGSFVLQSAAGPVSLEDFRGKAVLLYFGYTWCPDVCPTNLGYIGLALEQLTDARRDRVRVLFVSVDPERDTPRRLQEYTGFFHRNFIGLTADPERVAQVAAQYGAAYRKVPTPDSQAGYLVDHSAYTYLIDSRGQLRGTLNHATPPDRIAAAIRDLLEPPIL